MAARGGAWRARAIAAAVMATAAAAPGWLLWKDYSPLLAVFLACGGGFGAWLVGGAIARGGGPARVAFNGALAALLSFPIIGFFVGLGEACVGGPLRRDCLSLEGATERMVGLVVDEAARSAAPVALIGAVAALGAARLARWMSPP